MVLNVLHSDSGTLRNFAVDGTWTFGAGSVSQGLKLKFHDVAEQITTVWFVEAFLEQLSKIATVLENDDSADAQYKKLFTAVNEMSKKYNVEEGKTGRCRKISNTICDWLQKSLGGTKGVETAEQVCADTSGEIC